MKKSEKKVIKINWGQIIKRISPYNVKKGILYLRHYGMKEFG